MKRLLAILMALLMVVSLTACGSGDKDAETAKDEAVDTVDKEDAGEEKQEDKVEETEEETTEEDEKEDVVVKEVDTSDYEEVLGLFADLLLGDASGVEVTLPAEVWEAIAISREEEKDDVVAALAASFESFAGYFASVEYEITDENDASDDIEEIQEALALYGLKTEIEEAIELDVDWTFEVAEEYEMVSEDGVMPETLYVILVDGAWYVIDSDYNWYVLA